MGRDAEFPANGYQGDYISDLGREIGESAGTRFLEIEESEAVAEIGDLAREEMVAIIRQDLEGIGVEFDNWFSERSLYPEWRIRQGNGPPPVQELSFPAG